MQAYVQAHTKLIQQVFAWPPKEIAKEFLKGIIFIIMLPLYGIPKSRNHQFNTYHKYHVKNLQMKTFIYNLYLLITLRDNHTLGIIEMQIDNILIFGDAKFLMREQTEIDKAKFLIKLAQILNPISLLIFNGCIIIMDEESFYMSQKG